MRKLFPLSLFLLAAPLTIAQEPPRLLPGTRTVLVHAGEPALQELQAALAAEVPTLRFVATPKEADVMVELRVRFTWTGARASEPEIRHRDRYAKIYVTRGNEKESKPALVMNGVAGVVVRGKEEQIVYRAGSTTTEIEEFARAFGRAWRAVNP